MRSKNRKKNTATEAAVGSFGAYRVAVKGLGSLSIFAGSAKAAKAAEQVARRILGAVAHPYEGALEVCREEKTVTRRQRP